MSQHRSLALLLACIMTAACGKVGDSDTAARATVADTGQPLGATPAAGGVAAVTPTDAKSVRRATEYKLTEDNFTRFIAATDSLSALRKRDPAVAALLDQQINDTGADGTQVSGDDAGRVHLESNPAISSAIAGAGLSVRDYFVAAIAIAQAERFMGNPKSAPPTPTLGPNAEFLNAHKAQLQKLKAAQAR
jgi:hypothetical protein